MFWHYVYERIISLPNLLYAWREFKRGKSKRADVLAFEFDLENNLLELRQELLEKTYRPGHYQAFWVFDPKGRRIHKAAVRDRVVHQAIFRVLYYHFDRRFITDSYSCRFRHGTHAGVARWEQFARRVSINRQRPAYVLQCDISKFFDNINHSVLRGLLRRVVDEENLNRLLNLIISSFAVVSGRGLPLGNVTSQLFANVYLNELDRFAKHVLRERFYLRYCDDFLIAHHDSDHLFGLIDPIKQFLFNRLKLELHPQKISIRKTSQGVDWLGYVSLSHHRILRTKTKQRILNRLSRGEINSSNQNSYFGIVSHCRNYELESLLKESVGY